MGKILTMRRGAKGGLQYHREKDEAGYILTGELLVRYEENGQLVEKLLHRGQTVHFPPGVVHQEEALTDCVIIEFSNVVFNDRVRVEEQFGLPTGTGLPTTMRQEVRYELA